MSSKCRRSGCSRPAKDGMCCTLLCAGLAQQYLLTLDALDRQERRRARGDVHVVDGVLAELDELDALCTAVDRMYGVREQRVSTWRARQDASL